MNQKKLSVAVSMGSVLMLSSGCANFNATMDKHGGKIIGGISGAAVGALACDGDPVCIAAGVVGGLILGDLYDKRQEELRQLAEKKNIALETKSVTTFNSDKQNGFELSINDGGMFESSSAELKTRARLDLISVATIYREKPQKILVIGHTDATGSDTFNQNLSEQRALTVAKLFEEVGVPVEQIYFQGAGEAQPVATNDTMEGRASNRRVEVVEIDSEESLAAYNLQRQNDKRYLAHSNRTASERESIRGRVARTHPPEPSVPAEVADSKPATSRHATPSIHALIDFGGRPASTDFSPIRQAAGDTSSENNGTSFSFFSEAVASPEEDLSPCFMDAPRVTGDIQNLGTGEKLNAADLDMSEFWPGLNGNVWLDTVNGHMVAFQDLRIMRNSGVPDGRPTVRLYKDVDHNKEADFVSQPHIEAYPSENGLLMRAYFDAGYPVECMDVVMANNGGMSAKAGVFYYGEGQDLYEQDIILKRIQ